MKSIKNAIINTSCGQIKIVTVKEFVKLIPRKEWYVYTDIAGHYRRKTVGLYTNEGYYSPTYETVFKYLQKTPVTVADVVDGLPIKSRSKYDLIEMIYDITTESAAEMGNPTHIVRLGKRFWMAANPEDFIIFFNHNGSAVANLKPNKSIVWLVDR